MNLSKKKSLRQRSVPSADYTSLESRAMLANLSFVDAHLGFVPKETVIVGENIGVSANYMTDGLASDANYDIKIVVNGVEGYVTNVSNGAGGVDETFKSHLNTWSVGEGAHLVEVWLDPDNRVAETDETDNYFQFEFTPVQPDLDAPFVWPWQGVWFEDLVINSYPAVNPRSPYMDHLGFRQFTNAFKIHTVNNNLVDEGIPVYAMADGVVSTIYEGLPDRFTPGVSTTRTNTVRIWHGGDHEFQTIIKDMRRDSITVQEGDTVQAGQLIGFMSGSIFREEVSSSWTLFANNASFNPFVAPEIYFADTLPHAWQQLSVYDARVTNYAGPDSHISEGVSEFATFHPDDESEVHLYVRMGALDVGDEIKYQWRNPNGDLVHESTFEMIYLRTIHSGHASYQLPADAALGSWSVEVLVNDQFLQSIGFDVANQRTAAIRVEDSNVYGDDDIGLQSHDRLVSNHRYSPFDLGTYSPSASPDVFSYELINHGNTALNISDVRVPNGFQLVGSGPSTIAVGESATLSLQVDTSTIGYRHGLIEVVSDAAGDDSRYQFWVEGTVESDSSVFIDGHLMLGTAQRMIREGGDSFFANVRLPVFRSSDTVIHLEYSSSDVSGPGTVTVPAGKRHAVFEIEAPLDTLVQPDHVITITARVEGSLGDDIASVEVVYRDSGAPKGTPGNDYVVVDFQEMTLEINGRQHGLVIPPNGEVVSSLMGGYDRVEIKGTPERDTFRFAERNTLVSTSIGDIRFLDAQSVSFDGTGGNDLATIINSSEADSRASFADGITELEFSEFDIRVHNVDLVRITATEPGNHRLDFTDSESNDSINLSPTSSYFSTASGNLSATGFSQVMAVSQKGGIDRVTLTGTENADRFLFNSNRSLLDSNSTPNLLLTATNFSRSVIRGGAGRDRAYVTPEVDFSVYSTESFTRWSTESEYSRLESFEVTTMTASSVKATASSMGSVEIDHLLATPLFSRLSTPNRWIRFNRFAESVVDGMEGVDQAVFKGSSGDDLFVGQYQNSWMRGSGFLNRAIHFEKQRAEGQGGNDIARVQDSAAADYAVANEMRTRISSGIYSMVMQDFERHSFQFSSGGMDVVRIIDSTDDDNLYVVNDSATLRNSTTVHSFSGMSRVVAISENGGIDHLFESDLDIELFAFGDWL